MKRKPAGDVTIRLGDLFPNLDDDLFKASNAVAKDMRLAEDPEGMSCKQVRARLIKIYSRMWAHLMNSAVHSPGRGPKTPRLPAGLSFDDLLPHLVEARKAQAGDTSFNAWIRGHVWPGDMHPPAGTVRNWLKRYEKQIVRFDRLAKPDPQIARDQIW